MHKHQNPMKMTHFFKNLSAGLWSGFLNEWKMIENLMKNDRKSIKNDRKSIKNEHKMTNKL